MLLKSLGVFKCDLNIDMHNVKVQGDKSILKQDNSM